MTFYLHIKSGRTYEVVSEDIINATNAQDKQRMVLYKGEYKDKPGVGMFVREYEEFHEKFTLIAEDEKKFLKEIQKEKMKELWDNQEDKIFEE